MAYSSADFLAAFQALLPRGAAWSRDPASVQSRTLATLMPTWARLAARDENLVVDAFPATTVELLPEWEKSLGLPDPCAGESALLEERRAQVVARFAATGGQSVGYFVSFAATLGYAITVTEFAPRRFGQVFGTPFYGPDWAYAWQVNAPTFTVAYRQFGSSLFGEPYASWGSTVLQCELQRLKPAHTILIFSYS